jgi:hypothetical protein
VKSLKRIVAAVKTIWNAFYGQLGFIPNDEASKKEVFERLAEARIGGGDTLGRGHA